MSHCRRLLVVILLANPWACGGGGQGPSVDAGLAIGDAAGRPADASSASPDDLLEPDPDADVFIPCTDDPRADQYTAGMQKVGLKNQITMTLVSSEPAPPFKGTNTWTMLVADNGKAPQSGATLAVLPFMPDHGHGTAIKPVISSLPNAGNYQVTPLYLFMAGLWEVTFNVTTATGAQDTVVFSFCIQQ
jgi:YtkA-like